MMIFDMLEVKATLNTTRKNGSHSKKLDNEEMLMIVKDTKNNEKSKQIRMPSYQD